MVRRTINLEHDKVFIQTGDKLLGVGKESLTIHIADSKGKVRTKRFYYDDLLLMNATLEKIGKKKVE